MCTHALDESERYFLDGWHLFLSYMCMHLRVTKTIHLLICRGLGQSVDGSLLGDYLKQLVFAFS